MRVPLVALCVLLASGAIAVPAPASTATAPTVASLATRAADGDTAALATLRSVTVVDGRPVDLARALPTSVESVGAAARLRALARSVSSEGVPGAAADARTIVGEQRFGGPRPAGPLHGVARAIGRFASWVASPFAGTAGTVVWVIAIVGLLLIAAMSASAIVTRQRRAALLDARHGSRDRRGDADPDALEREARDAEAAGDLEHALRLRFEAGLVRLHGAGAIRLRASTSSGAVRSALGPSSFDELAGTHGDVVYGGRPARDSDLEEARATWPRVLDEVGRR